ncbi:MAG: 2-amino-4-hydroxy-6-hydroxymethyldihydropteridine diphosphokinase [Sphingobium sp.]|nr:2-amino-4-hydroxy-6-hydroxymethyldihydropteridine diphosphokinase [Sphingobium sp.]
MSAANEHRYILALGSNRPLSARLAPPALLRAAVAALAEAGQVLAVAPIHDSAPIGPSRRRYVNSALLLASPLPPDRMLDQVQAIERRFGRRRARRWGERTLDIDIILWSGGRWSSPALRIPHPAYRQRPFVLEPLAAIVPAWRDPITGLRIAHLRARLKKSRDQSIAGG